MKKILSLLFLANSCILTYGQVCTDIPISYSADSLYFTTSDGSGDSMFTFNILNEHPTQGFAYPQAKLEPLTPLPDGMTVNSINDPWVVFASSWNPGQHAPVHIYYNVTMPIPVNYAVTFRLWINNLTPVTDSCYFDDDIFIVLHPEAILSAADADLPSINIFPNPVTGGTLHIQHGLPGSVPIQLLDVTGQVVLLGTIVDDAAVSINHISNGIYLLNVFTPDGVINKKIVVAGN